MLGINDDSVFSDFEEEELQSPVPRKELEKDGRIIYMSWGLRMPKKFGAPVLCDLARLCYVTNSIRNSFSLRPTERRK